MKNMFSELISLCVLSGLLFFGVVNGLPARQTGDGGLTEPLKTMHLEADGWTMVFRATSGNGFNVYDAWMTGAHTHGSKPESMERSLGEHYRNPVINSWDGLGVEYVKFALYSQDKEVAFVIFNGKGKWLTNWFAKENVISSCYSDLTSVDVFNIFFNRRRLQT